MVVMMTVRFHRHGRCLRMGVPKVDLNVVLIVMEYPRLFPNIYKIQLHRKVPLSY